MQIDSRIAKRRPSVKPIFIDERNVRHDVVAKLHAHFRCKYCGTVYDIPIEESDVPKFRGNSDHLITETIIYYMGTCNRCVEI